MTLVEIQIDEVVLIKDGYVTIFLPQFELKIKQKVKQIKGRGTHDYIKLLGKSIPNKYHKPLLEMLYAHMEDDTIWTSEQILTKMKFLKHIENSRFKFIDNNWRRPISEFVGLGILTHPQQNEELYQLVREVARRTLSNGKFDKQTAVRPRSESET